MSTSAASSDSERGSAQAMVGSWDVTLTLAGAAARTRPGHVRRRRRHQVESANAAPALRGVSHGASRERIEPNLFAVTRVFFRFNPQTGTYLGTQKVNATRPVRVASQMAKRSALCRSRSYATRPKTSSLADLRGTAAGTRIRVEQISDQPWCGSMKRAGDRPASPTGWPQPVTQRMAHDARCDAGVTGELEGYVDLARQGAGFWSPPGLAFEWAGSQEPALSWPGVGLAAAHLRGRDPAHLDRWRTAKGGPPRLTTVAIASGVVDLGAGSASPFGAAQHQSGFSCLSACRSANDGHHAGRPLS